MTGNTLHANLAHSGTMTRTQLLARAKGVAMTYVYQGNLDEAVETMIERLDAHESLRIPDFMQDIGLVLARYGDEQGVILWIQGCQ